MEPFSALAIATSVVQFVDFSSKIVSGSRELYKSSTGLTNDNTDLNKITTTLHEMSSSITHPIDTGPSSQHMEQLKELCQGINHIAQELIATLEDIKLNNKTPWTSCLHALRSVWNEHKINKIQERLNDFRQQLTLVLVVVLRDEVYSGQKSVKHGIDAMHGRFIEYIDENRQWRTDMRKAIQKRYASQAAHEPLPFTPDTIDNLGLRSLSDRFCYRLLSSLRFSSIDDRHDHIHRRHLKTYEWIFQETNPNGVRWQNFAQWLKDDSPLYWITGKAGSGKSTLMKFLHNDSRTKNMFSSSYNLPVVEAGFFFWNSGTEMQTSQIGLIRTLLSQILRQCPDSAPIAFPEEWESYTLLGYIEEREVYSQDNEWSWIQLHRAFVRLAKHVCSDRALLLLIDGLDEYTGNHADLVAFLKELVSLSLPNFKMCASSRPWVIFEDAFRRSPSLRMQDFTLPDMIKYASTNFEENQGFKELENEHPAFSKRLVKEIAEKASGVFLWVVLVVKSLLLGLTNGDEIEDLQKRLDDLPSDLEDLFQKIFDDIEPSYRLQASKLLQLFRAFFHPPTILSLAFAEYPDIEDALEYPVKELTNQEMISKIERTRRRLNSRCRGLLEVPYHNFNEDSRVSYLHRTVKDFVEVKKRWDMIVAFGPPSFEPYGHIAKSNLMQVKTMTESRVPKHFISCTRNCADYASAIPETLRDLAFQIFEELESCLSKINKKTMQSVATHGGLIRGINFNGSLPEGMDAKDVPKIESFLHYTILDGYQWYVKEKMERLIDVRQPDLMPLQFLAAIAIFSDSTSNKLDPIQFIQFMLDHGCDPNETFNGETLKLYSSIWVSKPWVTATQSTKIKALHNLLEKYGGTIVVKSAESQISRSRHDHSGAIRNAPKLGMVDTKPPGELGPGTERTKSFSLRTLLSKRRRQRTT